MEKEDKKNKKTNPFDDLTFLGGFNAQKESSEDWEVPQTKAKYQKASNTIQDKPPETSEDEKSK